MPPNGFSGSFSSLLADTSEELFLGTTEARFSCFDFISARTSPPKANILLSVFWNGDGGQFKQIVTREEKRDFGATFVQNPQ